MEEKPPEPDPSSSPAPPGEPQGPQKAALELLERGHEPSGAPPPPLGGPAEPSDDELDLRSILRQAIRATTAIVAARRPAWSTSEEEVDLLVDVWEPVARKWFGELEVPPELVAGVVTLVVFAPKAVKDAKAQHAEEAEYEVREDVKE